MRNVLIWYSNLDGFWVASEKKAFRKIIYKIIGELNPRTY